MTRTTLGLLPSIESVLLVLKIALGTGRRVKFCPVVCGKSPIWDLNRTSFGAGASEETAAGRCGPSPCRIRRPPRSRHHPASIRPSGPRTPCCCGLPGRCCRGRGSRRPTTGRPRQSWRDMPGVPLPRSVGAVRQGRPTFGSLPFHRAGPRGGTGPR